MPLSDTRLLKSITLVNLLSYGSAGAPIELTPLNVLIGPNGSGKSNLVEAVSLLQASPKKLGANDLRDVIGNGGGVEEWIWKGASRKIASIDVLITNPRGLQPLRHVLAFREQSQTFHLEDERIENEHPDSGQERPYFYYQYQQGHPVLNISGQQRGLMRESVLPDSSILSQRQDPEQYPEVTYLGTVYDKIRIYREWTFGRNAVFRVPQKSDVRNDRLEENFSNLGVFLNKLRRNVPVKNKLVSALRDLYEGLTDFDVSIEGNTVQIYFTEGDFSVPATRLSDGTLRYLCLLAILCDSTPPPLICIEEPEIGLHPDLIPKIAELLLAASERTQVIVTTHSDILIDALSDHPEVVLVCEKHNGETTVKRLNATNLSIWLDKYRLGDLWMKGELGGTRW